MTAVKRAIFYFEDHREEMKRHIADEQPDSILIIGTSNKMVKQIAENLEIGSIKRIFQIEEVSSFEEIELAKTVRKKEGKHVIPLPTVEVKKDFSGYFMDRMRVLIKHRGQKHEMTEKTIVRPTFSYIGKYSISIKAIYQIMAFSVNDHPSVVRFIKGRMIEDDDGIHLSCDLLLNNFERLTRVGPKLQEIIKNTVEEMTGLHVKSIDIHIKNINVL